MSKFSLFLVSRLVTAVFASGIVTTQTNLTTKTVLSPEEQEVTNREIISQGLVEYSKICQNAYYDSHITDFITSFLKTGEFSDGINNNTCFFHCMLEMAGATDSNDGQFDQQQAAVLFTSRYSDSETVELIVAKCNKKQVKKDVCDEAYHFMMCVLKEMIHQHGVTNSLGKFELESTMLPIVN